MQLFKIVIAAITLVAGATASPVVAVSILTLFRSLPLNFRLRETPLRTSNLRIALIRIPLPASRETWEVHYERRMS
ncbi:hypothetical protein FB45DRAFT_934571, partial [Roridomyces roridus]